MGSEHLAVADRFWSYVTDSDPGICWPWRGARHRSGYGAFNISRRVHYAHRVAWALSYGPIPAGMDVRHSCDNPPCVNPRHLAVGTRSDNMQDARERGRLTQPDRRGSANGRAKISDATVREIRAKAASGQSYSALGREYDLTNVAVRNLVIGKSWKHVT